MTGGAGIRLKEENDAATEKGRSAMETNKMTIPATKANLPKVVSYVESFLEQEDCPIRTQMQVCIAVEEIFVNIASYAYAPETGDVQIGLPFVKGAVSEAD